MTEKHKLIGRCCYLRTRCVSGLFSYLFKKKNQAKETYYLRLSVQWLRSRRESHSKCITIVL